MIQRKFDPFTPFHYAEYGRMSTNKQNPRSPDQQFDEIERIIKQLAYPWIGCARYRDDGISGRKMTNRPGFMKMLSDIKSGRLKVDVILVDTLERFGRMEDVESIRRDLYNTYGVLILTADSNFNDPNSVAGKALGVIEGIRATSDAHVKAHNVLRGKRDTVRQKYWPGGPPPLGYKLDRIIQEIGGLKELVGSRLVPDPEWISCVREMFDLADREGLGTNRIAQNLNKRPDLVEKHGRFHADTIGRILTNQIYIGTMDFGRVSTDIINSRRVMVQNDADQHLRIEDFCEPIIDRDVWTRVNAVRAQRGEYLKGRRGRKKSNKQLQPIAPGLTLKYPLAGLVRCSVCGASMRPNQGGGVKSNRGRRYVYYMCPNANHGSCTNHLYCPEDWLRESVLGALRNHLFPTPKKYDGDVPGWFLELVSEIEASIDALDQSKQASTRPGLEAAQKGIECNIKGWTLSLADPNLPNAMRSTIMEQSKIACDRSERIKVELAMLDNLKNAVENELKPEHVLDCLQQLDTVMANANPTQLNIELSRHIDRIEVFPDRRVIMRTCRLGSFEGLDFLLSKPSTETLSPVPVQSDTFPVARITPRLRVKLNDGGADAMNTTAPTSARQIEDPDRFAGLESKWFWEDVFQMPEKRCWSEEHADGVAQARTGEKLSHAKLAQRFGVSIPTIRRALRVAAERATVVALN